MIPPARWWKGKSSSDCPALQLTAEDCKEWSFLTTNMDGRPLHGADAPIVHPAAVL